MLTAGTAAKVGSCYDNAALREVCSNGFIHTAQTMASNLFRISDRKKTARIDLIGIDIIAYYNDISCNLCFHDGYPPYKYFLGSVMQPFKMLAATVAGLAR